MRANRLINLRLSGQRSTRPRSRLSRSSVLIASVRSTGQNGNTSTELGFRLPGSLKQAVQGQVPTALLGKDPAHMVTQPWAFSLQRKPVAKRALRGDPAAPAAINVSPSP